MNHKKREKDNDGEMFNCTKDIVVTNSQLYPTPPTEVSLTSSLKGSRYGFHQKIFLVGGVDKGWDESIPQIALADLCASLESLQLSEMDKSL